jgi:DNA-binding transcriptional LysR family regulator
MGTAWGRGATLLNLVLADSPNDQGQPDEEKLRAPGRSRPIKITLRQLSMFEAVARCGSVAKAADEIALSQSAVSMALRDLEDRLQAQLFVRQGRKLVLSHYGCQVQARAITILRQAQELESFTVGGLMSGRLRVGATPSLACSDLARTCARFTARHPGVTIELSTAPSEEIIGKVHGMSLDFGFMAGRPDQEDLETRPWLNGPLTVFCAPQHPMAKRVGAPLQALLMEKWALEKHRTAERWSLTAEALNAEGSLQIAFESDSIEALKIAVGGGRLLGCLPRQTIAEELERGAFVDLRVAGIAGSSRASVVWKKSNYQGQLQQAFLDFLTFTRPMAS